MQCVNQEAANDIFNTLSLLAPDSEAFLPPCFYMTAAREMGYYPTPRYLQDCLSAVLGSGNRLTLQLFLQLCAMLESTRALDASIIRCYRDAFDVRGSGVLSRNEFRTILSTSAEADMSSSEVESILDLLDPTYTNVIQLQAIEAILTRCVLGGSVPLSSGTACCTQSNAPKVVGGSAETTMRDTHVQQCGLSFVADGNKPLLCDSKVSRRKGTGKVPLEAPPVGEYYGNYPFCGPLSAIPTRQTSPYPSAPDEAMYSRAEASPGLPPPKTTAPSPYTSGNVTRATSLQQNFLSHEPFPAQQDPFPPPDAHVDVSHSVSRSVHKNHARKSAMSGHSVFPPSHVSHTVIPSTNGSANNREKQQQPQEQAQREQQQPNKVEIDSAPSNVGGSRTADLSSRPRVSPYSRPEELREFVFEHPRTPRERGGPGIVYVEDAGMDDISVSRNIRPSLDAVDENGNRNSRMRGKRSGRKRFWCHNHCHVL